MWSCALVLAVVPLRNLENYSDISKVCVTIGDDITPSLPPVVLNDLSSFLQS